MVKKDSGNRTSLDINDLIGEALILDPRRSAEAPDTGRLRRELLDQTDIRDKVPEFVRRYRDLGQFWQFIKSKFKHYAERREFIWGNFSPLIEYLEAFDRSPGSQPIGETLQAFDPDNVHAAWQKALVRRVADPEGAITAARTLLESVCKHILDDAGVAYPDGADLPKLWAMTAESLDLATRSSCPSNLRRREFHQRSQCTHEKFAPQPVSPSNELKACESR